MTDNVEFQILEWEQFHSENEQGKQVFSIRLFGKTRSNETIYVQVNDFKPYFFVEIDSRLRFNHIEKIIEDIKKRVYPKQYVDELKQHEVVQKYKFYGFTNYKKFSFLKLTFDNHDAMKAYSRTFEKTKLYIPAISPRKPIKLKVYESNIIPFIRFMHIQQLESVGWVSIDKNNLLDFDDKPTCCKYNYQVNWRNIKSVKDKFIQKFTIAAFDIECTSADGTFPQPERETDKVILIGITYSRFGEDDCYHKHILCLDETSDVEGATVEWFKTEEELLCAFTKHIREYDPDIITGYNIFGFDFEYLKKRADKLGIGLKFSRLSRINNEISEFVTKELASSALGDNILKFYKMTGRVLIDLFKVVQREYKLSSYKLDNVASNFIRDVALEITNTDKNMFLIKTKNTYGISLGQYISITYLDNNIEFKYLDGKKFKINDFTKDTIICEGNVNVKELIDKHFKIYWCQNKDDVSPNDIFTMFKQTPKDRAIIAKYCIQDCVLCNKLINKLQVITNNVGMANVCHVPFSFIFLRGQGIKIFSLVSKKCMEKEFLIPVLKYKQKKTEEQKIEEQKKIDKQIENFERKLFYKNDEEETEEEDDDTKYEGAIVFPPKEGVHFEPVIVLDFASLYPNSMIFRNLSHETLVMENIYDNLQGYRYNEVSYKNEDGSVTKCRFAEKIDGTKGIIPEILMDLLAARKSTRKLMETEKDGFMLKILDSLQLAYKITANSLYGQTGASTSSIYLKKIAASTTATGREMLKFSKYFVENIYTTLVNLALDNKTKFYEEINKYYTYYPNEIDMKEEKIHIHTDKNLVIDSKKFFRSEVGYELEFKFYDEFKNIIGLDEKSWKEFIENLLNMNIAQRNNFINNFKNLILSEKPKKNTFFTENKEFYEKMKFDKNKYLTLFNNLYNFDKKKDFCNKLIKFVDNIGYKTKQDFFDKFYFTVNELLKGYHIKFEIIYGDSVTFDTPVILKQKDKILVTTIDDITDSWKTYGNKEQNSNNIDYEIWTDIGWTKINKVIRHKTDKKIYEILTHTGCVRVTEDHSLLDENGNIISVNNCKVGTKLLQNYPKIIQNKINGMTINKAYIYGYFFGDGSCGKYVNSKYSWALNSNNYDLCEKLKHKLEVIYKKKFKILDTLKSSGAYKIVPSHGNIKSYVDEFRHMFYDKYKNKIIPPVIFNCSEKIRKAFLDGYYVADGCVADTKKCNCHRFDIKSQISAQNMFILVKSLGYNVSLNKRNDKPEIFRLTYSNNNFRKKSNVIKKITEIKNYTGYVYDLETENHHFHCGVGDIIVHNTDSVFCIPHIKNDKTGEILKDKHALEVGINLGIWASICICTMLPSPMAQEYEKVLWPLALVSKKRYVGNLYEKNTIKYYQKSMGNVLKRRDNAQIVKIVYGGIINQILNLRNPKGAVEFVRSTLMNIITGKFKIDKFVITKTLNSNYKNRSNIVHAVLADRMAERDPGNKPQVNDRIPFVYFENPDLIHKRAKDKILQGERVETPEYIQEHSLKIDYLFYITNQIMKPAMEILNLVVYNPEKIFKDYIIREENRKKCLIPITYYCTESNENTVSIEELATKKIENNTPNKKVVRKKKVITNKQKFIDLNEIFK